MNVRVRGGDQRTAKTSLGCYPLMVLAGFRRYSTYRQAMLAGLATNMVFGLMRVSVLLAVFAGQSRVAGYDAAATATYVWLGQGLLFVSSIWGSMELSERVRSGDVAIDLSRPWDLQAALLAEDLGRAGYALLIRFLPPVAFGALLFPFVWPSNPLTLMAFTFSVLLMVVITFSARFMLNLLAFWLLDVRGPAGLYGVVAPTLAGLSVPLAFFPDWARTALWFTPFPAMLQSPIDIYLERGTALGLLAHQLLWAVALLAMGRVVQRRAERKLVVQGG